MKLLSIFSKKNSKKGFTLVELVIVIAVLAIIAAIAIPTVNGVVKNANKATDDSNMQALMMTIKTYSAQYEAKETHTLETVVNNLTASSTGAQLLAAYGTTMPTPKGQTGVFLWDKTNKTVTIGAKPGDNNGDTVEIATATLTQMAVGVGA